MQRTDLSLRSHCDLSIERVCLDTNMADSNRRQGRSHVGENQESRTSYTYTFQMYTSSQSKYWTQTNTTDRINVLIRRT